MEFKEGVWKTVFGTMDGGMKTFKDFDDIYQSTNIFRYYLESKD
jgi:hypothetical protein